MHIVQSCIERSRRNQAVDQFEGICRDDKEHGVVVLEKFPADDGDGCFDGFDVLTSVIVESRIVFVVALKRRVQTVKVFLSVQKEDEIVDEIGETATVEQHQLVFFVGRGRHERAHHVNHAVCKLEICVSVLVLEDGILGLECGVVEQTDGRGPSAGAKGNVVPIAKCR